MDWWGPKKVGVRIVQSTCKDTKPVPLTLLDSVIFISTQVSTSFPRHCEFLPPPFPANSVGEITFPYTGEIARGPLPVLFEGSPVTLGAGVGGEGAVRP